MEGFELETSGEAARVGGPEAETSRGRWLAWLGLGADVSDAAAAVGFISAFALAGLAGMAMTGDEVGAATPAVPGVTATLDVTDKERGCFDRYRWQPALRNDLCAGFDEMVGAPGAVGGDASGGEVDTIVATVSPSIGAPGAAPAVDLADRKLECLRRYRWQPELRREICAKLDELVGEPEALRDDEGNGKDNR